MIPQGTALVTAVTEEVQQPSRTYRIDLINKRVRGMVDGLDAVKQAVYKILRTERFWYLIYDFNYGVELDRLVGSNPLFIESELTRRITEALKQDDRILRIENMVVTINGDSLLAEFTVVTKFGDFRAEREVMRRV